MIPPQDKFDDFLRRRGLKLTTERNEILEAILAQDGHYEVEDLLFDMRKAGKRVSRATVYRTVDLLVQCGILMRIELGRNQIRYEHTYKKEHPGFHHHMYCRETGKIEEFSSKELDELLTRICREHEFTPESMRVVINGLSKEGRAKAEGGQP